MAKLNEKYYNLLNQIYNKKIRVNDLIHEDCSVLIQAGFLARENINIVSAEGILALDEYRSQIDEKNKSSKLLVFSIITVIISAFSLIISFIALLRS